MSSHLILSRAIPLMRAAAAPLRQTPILFSVRAVSSACHHQQQQTRRNFYDMSDCITFSHDNQHHSDWHNHHHAPADGFEQHELHTLAEDLQAHSEELITLAQDMEAIHNLTLVLHFLEEKMQLGASREVQSNIEKLMTNPAVLQCLDRMETAPLSFNERGVILELRSKVGSC